ncbi:MAG: superoxide dismutase family protein [Planctomycetota bacterium]|nr:superoxide dismutase family protein [Planctomycetota bacterium]
MTLIRCNFLCCLLMVLITLSSGCNRQADFPAIPAANDQMMQMNLVGQTLVAVMNPTAGNQARGNVTFTTLKNGILVEANIAGLTPGDHAIHIHQYGDLRLENGKGTGGHYNPEGHAHALPATDMRHAGDLGNLSADADGNASYSITISNVTLDGAHNPIIGRGVIIHAKVDDGGQPTGNAGARVSQGTIGYANPG